MPEYRVNSFQGGLTVYMLLMGRQKQLEFGSVGGWPQETHLSLAFTSLDKKLGPALNGLGICGDKHWSTICIIALRCAETNYFLGDVEIYKEPKNNMRLQLGTFLD